MTLLSVSPIRYRFLRSLSPRTSNHLESVKVIFFYLPPRTPQKNCYYFWHWFVLNLSKGDVPRVSTQQGHFKDALAPLESKAWHTRHSPSASTSHLSQTSGQILSTKVSATSTAQADAILSFSHRRFSHTGEKLENKPENWNVLQWIDKWCCKLKWGKRKCRLRASVRKDLTQDPCGQCTWRSSYLQFVPLCASVLPGECLPA